MNTSLKRHVAPRAHFGKSPRPRPARKILVAEDDANLRLMLRTLLELKGYRVVEAADGQEAVELAQVERPDAVLADLQLPRLNGFALTRFVRLHDALRDVPVVILTGHDPARHRDLALAAGCNAYLLKPVNTHQLEELLAGLLETV